MVGVRVGKVELGQGILTALAQIAADELGRRPRRRSGCCRPTPRGPDEGLTAGSMSIVDCRPGAAAGRRATCARCSCRRRPAAWPSTRPTSRRGRRFTGPADAGATLRRTGRLGRPGRAGRPARARQAGRRARSAGTSAPRLDLPDKVPAGRATSPTCACPASCTAGCSDRRRRAPGCAHRPGRCRAGRRRGGAGARRLVPRRRRSATRRRWPRAAEQLRARLRWDEHDMLPDEDDLDALPAGRPARETIAVDDDAEPPAGRRHRVLRATYSRPFLAHASIAPSCGMARWRTDDRLHVWSHSQGIYGLPAAIAAALGLDPAAVDGGARRERRLLRPQRRRRRRVRRGAAGPGRARPPGAGAVEPARRADLGAVRLGDDRRRLGDARRRPD